MARQIKPVKAKEVPEAVSESKLTHRQQAFVFEYFKDYNATQAAIRAGYSAATAGSIGHELLKKPEIRELIGQHLCDLGINADRVLAEYAALAYSDMGDYVTIEDGGELSYKSTKSLKGKTKLIRKIKEKRRILSSGEGSGDNVVIDSQVEIELYDKQKALDGLAKVLKLVKDEPEKPPEAPKIQPLSYRQYWNMSEDELILYIAGQYDPPPDDGAP